MRVTWTQISPWLKAALPQSGRKRRWWSYLSVGVVVFFGVGLGLIWDVLPRSGASYTQVTARAQAQTQPLPEPPADKPKGGLTVLSPGDIPLLKSLQSLQARLEAMRQQEGELKEREEGLKMLEKQLEGKLTQLQTLRQEIGQLMEERSEFEKKRFGHLVKVYEGMKPPEAAALVERLQEETAIRLLASMKSSKVSKILGVVKPERAVKLSEKLAIVERQQARENTP